LSRQRLTKKQIREDPVLAAIKDARSWITDHANLLLIAAGAVILILGVSTAIRNARANAEADAATQLAQAQYNLWGDNFEQARQLADEVVSRWPGTRSAHLAQLIKADALYGTGDAPGALAAYDAFLAGKSADVLRLAALRGRAAATEDAGRPAEAAEQYEALARQHDLGTVKAADLSSAARCHEQAGDPEAARALYAEVADAFPNTQQGQLAKLKLEQLGGV